jgi:hypothetical protein
VRWQIEEINMIPALIIAAVALFVACIVLVGGLGYRAGWNDGRRDGTDRVRHCALYWQDRLYHATALAEAAHAENHLLRATNASVRAIVGTGRN